MQCAVDARPMDTGRKAGSRRVLGVDGSHSSKKAERAKLIKGCPSSRHCGTSRAGAFGGCKITLAYQAVELWI